MSVEHFLRRRRCVSDGPMIDRSFGDQANGRVRDPFPENDVFSTSVGFNFLLRLQIENLQCPRCCEAGSEVELVWKRKASAKRPPLSASIFCLGCIIAESAVMCRRRTLLALARSMMTTWFCSPTVSRTHIKWSDSNVKVYIRRK